MRFDQRHALAAGSAGRYERAMKRNSAIPTATLLATLFVPLALAGCSGASKTFGLSLTPPNAFDVATEAPLSMPPELATLPRPNPGAPRPQQISSSQQAEALLAPSSVTSASSAAMGPGQSSLLAQAGPTPPSDIRAIVNREAGETSKSPGFVARIMNFGAAPSTTPTLVNAAAEQRRLQENAALGAPVTQGATPQTTEAKPGLLGRIMNFF
jgi:hypothetical protein